MEERLQKVLARAGLGSRRHCETLIQEGRILVDGRVASLGMKVDVTREKISFDGKMVKPDEEHLYILIYKPRNVISSVRAPDSRACVRDLIPISATLYPVGRLDVDSEGLLLLTNDGELTNQLTHPRYEHEKQYQVLVARHPDTQQLQAWRSGVVLEDGFQTHRAEVKVLKPEGRGTWLDVILHEGHKRQIREMGKMTGLPVVRIIRVRMATLSLGKLKPGQWRHLTSREIDDLKNA